MDVTALQAFLIRQSLEMRKQYFKKDGTSIKPVDGKYSSSKCDWRFRNNKLILEIKIANISKQRSNYRLTMASC